ncbi:DUF1800 domain-containing protein [Pararhodobacter zhoushanensis]|uniref:DUF1800 domain-containing protein n=1 Tax=Pararhodobacter zhoushanensis TaxID=2479545 RepID=UPI0013DF606F|nr:DUF1800 domain-containing protein [Pararhodobacter zhoushanensis]
MRTIASFIALNRFGLGAAPGEADAIGDDPRGWLSAQIQPSAPLPEALRGFRSSEAIINGILSARLESPEAQQRERRRAQEQDFDAEMLARASQMITTRAPLAERLVLFWSNHFTVSSARRQIAPAIPSFEREAIRPHVFGRFADMLLTVVQHPSMLVYLDNTYSIGPGSPAGLRHLQRNPTRTTLNENLAREVLELHTLGVHGGYTQADVIQFALALTGWTHGGVRRGDRPRHGGFQFIQRHHEPGDKTVLGQRYAEGGVDEGVQILNALARHPATAHHLATKLVRHFVADDPPEAAVEQIARVYLETDGDLGRVMQAVIDLDAAWADPLAKVKPHYDYVIAVHRAAGQGAPHRRDIVQPLRLLAHLPFTAPSPQGWGDRAADWIGPEALMIRLEWVNRFTSRLPGGVNPRAVMEQSIGAVARDVTQTWVYRAPSADAALTLLFGSPEFQRR